MAQNIISQLGLEFIEVPNPKATISQASQEAILRNSPNVRLSDVGREVIQPYSAQPVQTIIQFICP